jgi:hypothetical protein
MSKYKVSRTGFNLRSTEQNNKTSQEHNNNSDQPCESSKNTNTATENLWTTPLTFNSDVTNTRDTSMQMDILPFLKASASRGNRKDAVKKNIQPEPIIDSAYFPSIQGEENRKNQLLQLTNPTNLMHDHGAPTIVTDKRVSKIEKTALMTGYQFDPFPDFFKLKLTHRGKPIKRNPNVSEPIQQDIKQKSCNKIVEKLRSKTLDINRHMNPESVEVFALSNVFPITTTRNTRRTDEDITNQRHNNTQIISKYPLSGTFIPTKMKTRRGGDTTNTNNINKPIVTNIPYAQSPDKPKTANLSRRIAGRNAKVKKIQLMVENKTANLRGGSRMPVDQPKVMITRRKNTSPMVPNKSGIKNGPFMYTPRIDSHNESRRSTNSTNDLDLNRAMKKADTFNPTINNRNPIFHTTRADTIPMNTKREVQAVVQMPPKFTIQNVLRNLEEAKTLTYPENNINIVTFPQPRNGVPMLSARNTEQKKKSRKDVQSSLEQPPPLVLQEGKRASSKDNKFMQEVRITGARYDEHDKYGPKFPKSDKN